MPTRFFRIFALLACFVAALCPASFAAAQLTQPVLVPTGNRPAAIYAADANGDGLPDLIVVDADATATASTTRVLLGDGHGGFTQSATLATAGKSIIATTTNLDSAFRIVWISVTDHTASLLSANGKGDGTFYPTSALTAFPFSGTHAPTPLIAVTAVRPRYGRAAILIADTANATLYEAVLNPDGTYAVSPVTSFPGIPVIPGVTGLSAADVNGDAGPDAILQAPAAVQVVLGAQTGLDNTSFTHPAANGVESVLIADMDSDGVPDLVTADKDGRIDIFRGSADGTFATATEIGSGASDASTGRGGHLVAIADLNADGILDIVTATPLGINVLFGHAGLSYTLKGTYYAGTAPSIFAVGDFNRDGHLDLAIDNPRGVLILYGKPDASFAAQLIAGLNLVSTPDPSAYGADFTLTAPVYVPQSGAPVPTGTVTFAVDGAAVATVPLTGSLATYTIAAPALLKGSHTLTASYSGDTVYIPGSVTATHTIAGLRSQTTYTNKTPSIFYGQVADGVGSVAAVDASGTATVNGGTISFFQDGALICVLPVNGAAGTCPVSAGAGLAAGTHTITAAYSGNDFYAASTSDPSAGFVQVLPDITTTTLTSTPNPAGTGQSVTFTAKVSAPYATPTSVVTFYDGSTRLFTSALDSTGSATFPTSTLSVGTHNITASYAADTNFNASFSAALPQVIVAPALPATTTLVSSSINPSFVGQPVTFTATVAAPGGAIPIGTVSFTVDNTTLSPITLSTTATATITATALTQGTHTIVATYNGSPTVAASTSPALVQQVNAQGAGGFTLMVNPSNLSVPIGSSVSVFVTVTPLNGFAQPVNLACSNMPSESACTFADTTIPAGGGSTRLTVYAAAPHACGTTTPYFIASGPTTLLDALVTTALIFLLRRRRNLLKGLTLAFTLIFLPSLSGCGGNCTDLGVRPGTYSLTVTATSTGAPTASVSQAVKFTAHL